MKHICIYGLGAIGGLLAARLAASGHSVSAIARSATRDIVNEDGLHWTEGGIERTVPIRATDDPRDLGPQDLVILSVKTTALPEIAARISPLIGPTTTVLSAMNGIPWWFMHGLGRAPNGLTLARVDPAGVLSKAVAPSLVVGCVTHLSAAVATPGRVQHVAGNRLIVGEPTSGPETARARAVYDLLVHAGFEVELTPSIQQEIWFKLWGNMTVNPVSLLTAATGDLMLDDPLVRAFMSRCMVEASALGSRLGLPIYADPEARHAVTRKLGAFKTSMLQDVEGGKQVELDALLGVVIDLARQLEVDTPNLDALFGLARMRASQLGLYSRSEATAA